MADFNWNDHPVVDEKPSFNWDDHQVVEDTSKPKSSLVADQANPTTKDVKPQELFGSEELGSAARGYVHGGTFGLDDRAIAAVRTMLSSLGMDKGFRDEPIYDTYEKNLEAQRQKTEASKEANTKSFYAGDFLGGAAGIGGAGLLKGTLTGAAEAAPIAESVGTTAAKEAAGQSASQAFPRLSQMKSLKDVFGAVVNGAKYGAITGVTGSKDLTDVGDVAKNALVGTGLGAVGGGVLHTAASTVGSVLGGVGKAVSTTPLAKEFKRGLGAALRGKVDIADTQAGLESLRGATGSVIDNLNTFEDKLQNGYNEILDNAGADIQVPHEEIDQAFDSVKKPIQDVVGDSYDSQFGKIDKILSKLKGGSNPASEEAPEGLLNEESLPEAVTPRRLKIAIDEIQDMADRSYNPVTKTGNDPALFRVATATRDQLKGLLVKSLGTATDEEGASLGQKYLDLDDQFKKLVDLKGELGIKGKVDSDSGNLAIQNASRDASEGLSTDLIKSVSGNDDASIHLDRVFSKLGDMQESMLSPEEIDQVGSADDIAKSLKTQAEDYYSARTASQKSIFSSENRFFLSPKALATRTGMVAGGGLKTASEIASVPIAAARDISDLVTSKSEIAANIADSMSNAISSPTTQKAGQMLKKILVEPDVNYRRALMFSLGQQPWFRDEVAKFITRAGGVK